MEFPTIKRPSFPLKETIPDHTIKGQTDGITMFTRPRFTKVPRSFTLSWSRLPITDYERLRHFYYNEVKGNALVFLWTYPDIPGNSLSGKKLTVRFDGDFEFELSDYDCYTGSIKVTEV